MIELIWQTISKENTIMIRSCVSLALNVNCPHLDGVKHIVRLSTKHS